VKNPILFYERLPLMSLLFDDVELKFLECIVFEIFDLMCFGSCLCSKQIFSPSCLEPDFECSEFEDDLLKQIVVMKECGMLAASTDKKCFKCGDVMIYAVNCTKTQYKMNKGRCAKCTQNVSSTGNLVYQVISFDEKSVELVAHPTSQFSEISHKKLNNFLKMTDVFVQETSKAQFVLNQQDFVAVDFEVSCRDRSKILECGLAYFNSCCTNFVVEHFVVIDNMCYSNSPYMPSNRQKFNYGVSQYILLKDLETKLFNYSNFFQTWVSIDSRLEQKLFHAMGIPGEFLDVQMLDGVLGERIGAKSLISKYSLKIFDCHNAGNDAVVAYASFLKISEGLLELDYPRSFDLSQLAQLDFSVESVFNFNFLNERCDYCLSLIDDFPLRSFTYDNYHRFIWLYFCVLNTKNYQIHKFVSTAKIRPVLPPLTGRVIESEFSFESPSSYWADSN